MCTVFGGNLTAAVDRELCTGGGHGGGGAGVACSPAAPCLYNVMLDPSERVNLAAQYPSKVTAMIARLEVYAAKSRLPLVIPDTGGFCETCAARGEGPGGTHGYNGPWVPMPTTAVMQNASDFVSTDNKPL